MTATIACITPMTPEQARKVLADAGLSYPNFLDQFETMSDYIAFLQAMPPSTVIATGRAMQVLSDEEEGRDGPE